MTARGHGERGCSSLKYEGVSESADLMELAKEDDFPVNYVVVRYYIATRKIHNVVTSDLPRASVAPLSEPPRSGVQQHLYDGTAIW